MFLWCIVKRLKWRYWFGSVFVIFLFYITKMFAEVVCKFLPIFPMSIFLHSVQVYRLCSRLWRRPNARNGTFVVNLYLHGENLTLIILFYQILVC